VREAIEGKGFGIELRDREGMRIIAPRGEVDLSTAPELRRILLEAIAGAGGPVGVDLGGVRYMDSSGVAVLIEGLQASRRRRLRYVLLAPSKQVRNVLSLTRLDGVFEIADSPGDDPAGSGSAGERG